MAATPWRTNGDLVVSCFELGYLHDDWLTADVTYGRGVWWKKRRPTNLVCHDVRADGVSFLALPEDDETYRAVAFDPPYVATGTRSKTTMPEFYDRYGLVEAPRTPADLQRILINRGLDEVYRVLEAPVRGVHRGGIALVKCQDYVSSGKLWIGTHHTLTHALSIGFTVIDRMERIGKQRPQPKRSRKDGKPSVQQHARRNLSTLFVLQKGNR